LMLAKEIISSLDHQEKERNDRKTSQKKMISEQIKSR